MALQSNSLLLKMKIDVAGFVMVIAFLMNVDFLRDAKLFATLYFCYFFGDGNCWVSFMFWYLCDILSVKNVR